jgi:hypothetical protein
MKFLTSEELTVVNGGYRTMGDAVLGNAMVFGALGGFIGSTAGVDGFVTGAILGGTFGGWIGVMDYVNTSTYPTNTYSSPVYYQAPEPVIYYYI